MFRLFNCLLLTILTTFSLLANCPEENISLSTQAEVDSFKIGYPDCTEFVGNIFIGQEGFNAESDIYNLEGLSHLTSIIGDIELKQNDLLVNLDELNIQSITGNLTLDRNANLIDLTGLEGLTRLEGSLDIDANADDFSCNGLQNLKTIEGNFNVNFQRNSVLDGLAIDSIYGNLTFYQASLMSSINGLSELVYVGGKFTLNRTGINNISALSNLTSIGGVELNKNYSSVNLSGLKNIEIIHGDLIIEEIDDLSSLAKFESLHTIEGNFEVANIWYLDIGTLPVRRIGGDFIFNDNNLTHDVNGMSTLEYIGGDMVFTNTNDLETITGFTALDTIGGDFRVSNLYSSMKDFTFMNTVKYIGGDVTFSGHWHLEAINGFESLETVCGNYSSRGNDLLTEINLPSNLKSLGGLNLYANEELLTINGGEDIKMGKGDIIIYYNPELTFIPDLTAIDTIRGDLMVSSNFDLDSVSFDNLTYIGGDMELSSISGDIGISQLDYVGGNLSLESMNGVTDLDWLSNLNDINGDLKIRSLSNLESLNSLSNIDSIHGSMTLSSLNVKEIQLDKLVYIKSNCNLTWLREIENLDGFNNLEVIGGQVDLVSNDKLVDIIGLESLKVDSLNRSDSPYGIDLDISHNDILTECNIKPICDLLADSGKTFEIDDNGIGCSRPGEIECLEYGISGIVFYDLNQNGIKDLNEYGIKNIGISISNPDQIFYTNANGKYLIPGNENDQYQVEILHDNSEWLLVNNEPILTVTFSAGMSTNAGNNFGLYPKFERHDLDVSLSSGPTRCNTKANYILSIVNTGNQLESGQVKMLKDELVNLSSYSDNPSGFGDLKTWDFDTLYPQQRYEITFEGETPSEQLTGETLSFNTAIERAEGENFILIDSMEYNPIVLCSYDPNDKLVSPPGVKDEHYTLIEDDLYYTVRFQNTGNAPAIDVRILDTIDQHIDLGTFEVVQSSAPVFTCLEERVVDFYFKDIWLPDSLSNPRGSQGFITYKVNVVDDIEDFEVVNNSAGIYFDFNPPIITNTTLNTMVTEICDDKFTVIDTTICGYEDYLGYTTSQTIRDTIPLSITCDSFVTTNLVVNSYFEREYDRIACLGSEVWISTDYIIATESSILIDTVYHFGDSTCIRSIDVYNIYVEEPIITYQDSTVCQGDLVYDYGDPGEHTVSMYNFATSCYDTIYLTLMHYETENPLCVDSDGDGYVGSEDCDDTNPDVYPYAVEICDHLDNDCDGQVDEFLSQYTYYIDDDGDGFGNPDVAIQDCAPPAGYSLLNTDCDDDDPNINPDAIEFPGNGIDENCDGSEVSVFDNFPLVDIGELKETNVNGENTYAGERVSVIGVVHSINFLAPSDLLINVMDENRNGVFVYDAGIWSDYDPKLGDRVVVHGFANQFNGLLEVETAYITVLDQGHGLYLPQVVESLGEDTEADIVQLTNVTLSDPMDWLGDGSSFNVTVTDGTESHTVRINRGSYWSSQPPPMGNINIIGIGSQYDTSSPYLEGYQLFPRIEGDIFISTSTDDISTIEQKRSTLTPNPNDGMFSVKADADITQVTLLDIRGKIILNTLYQRSSQIDLKVDQPGLYIVKLIVDGSLEVHRVLVD